MYSFDSISGTIKDEDFLPESHFQHHIGNEESLVDAVPEILQPDHLPALTKEEPVYQHIVEVHQKKPKERKVPLWLDFLVHIYLYFELQLQVCHICNKTFSSNYKLTEHMRSHSDATPFQCVHDGCCKKFRSKIGLKQHEAQHTGEVLIK